MTSAKSAGKKAPTASIKSAQYELFTQFITNDKNDVSNTVEVWESIPKYFFTPAQVVKLRTPTGHADPYPWKYDYNGITYTVTIQPALIKQRNGSYKAFFPGITEELVEEALKKILTDQRYGLHDPGNMETWVRFSLSMIKKELKSRGRARDLDEIKHAIEVMSGCVITLSKEGKPVWKGAILQDLTTIDRAEYLADAKAQHVARLPLFISNAINQLDYRQFNYDRLMSCNEQLTRWIYKILINRYRQASVINEYHFMYTKLERDSGLLQQRRSNDNRRKVIAALDELINRKVLIGYDVDVRKQGRKIIDVKYTVRPAGDFVSEQKAANMRKSNQPALK
ncbi:MAG: hypothetical protein GY820_35505 [Gammaproteobacteria bacterium]|nr:hypothetical protein [Gammaproteobacteria bacterium]